ncbi:hypothetical protein PR003_g759 [Phytophthora rubi]|uniref:Uncharacterized protein n=1 Tax=Phytophthora rubi TaxID=129364 RepID=A0A6A3PFL6_9STRA|nr:hypothetical protein PR002_g579 [Phytophthora rubi]KAE9052409.1 hypothetical protein PR001_g522 [Phytophthora rubi]KAE9359381.1 hypothetical protein PR003_g759 [Phytophthora rubi]
MGKSTDRNATEEEFSKLEQVLNQTGDDASNCLKLLKKHLSEYDSRNGNHFVNTASSYMRGDMRTAKDSAMELKHVAHKINKSHKPSKSEVSSARNLMDVTSKAMDSLKLTARNYDKENGQSMGVKGTIDAAVGGHHDKEKEKDEKREGLFGRDDKEKEREGGLFGKSDKEKDEHHGRMLDHPDNNGGGVMGSSDTVETLVTKTLRDHFSLNALDQQLKAAEKSLSPSIVDRAKEAVHDVKGKLTGDKSSSTHEGHHAKHAANP